MLALTACSSSCTPSPTAPRAFGLYAVWLQGAGDENRVENDRFLRCLIEGSNFNDYWRGEAQVVLRSTHTVPAPVEPVLWDSMPAWLTAQRAAGHLPAPRPGETPLYVVYGGEPLLKVRACGRNLQGDVAGVNAAIGVVRNSPHCWPTRDRLRTETQIAAHEIVESVDRVLGYGTCAGGGTCRGRGVCPDPCDTFVGLTCPGAPTGTYTGCSGGVVDGWVVQKFSHAGRDRARCDACAVCDFVPVAHRVAP